MYYPLPPPKSRRIISVSRGKASCKFICSELTLALTLSVSPACFAEGPVTPQVIPWQHVALSLWCSCSCGNLTSFSGPRMIEPKAIRHSTKASKLTGISEYEGIRNYVPQRVKHHLTQCPAPGAKRRSLNQSTGTKQ